MKRVMAEIAVVRCRHTNVLCVGRKGASVEGVEVKRVVKDVKR